MSRVIWEEVWLVTRLSAWNADTEKQEITLKTVSVLLKDVDTWVTEHKYTDIIPDLDLLIEQHCALKRRILNVFNEATIRRIELKVLSQVQGLNKRIDKVWVQVQASNQIEEHKK